MGLFDKLVSIGKNIVEDELEKKIVENIPNEYKTSLSRNTKSIPITYSEFPVFNGIISNMYEKNESNYKRCTIDYEKTTDDVIDNYISNVVSNGYIKASNVRYDKGNTYIIIENNDGYLHLVFHIKK